jgi:hypothetical protein
MRLLTTFAAAAVTLTVGSSAFAQAPAPSERWVYPAACKEVGTAESEQGHALYLAAKVKSDNGKYDAALDDFIAAYGKDCSKPVILLAISKTHELNGDRKEAIRAIELYLQRNPGAEDAATQRNRAAALRTKLAEDDAKRANAGNTGGATGNGAGGHDDKPSTNGPGAAPWVVVGVGGAVLVTGVVLLATATYPSGCDASTNKCVVSASTPNAQTVLDKTLSDANAARTQKGIGGVLTGVGVAGVGAGLAWYFLAKSHEKPAATARTFELAPAVTPTFAGLSAAGSF